MSTIQQSQREQTRPRQGSGLSGYVLHTHALLSSNAQYNRAAGQQHTNCVHLIAFLIAQALVHARSTSTDVRHGIQLAELLMDKQDTDPQFKVRLAFGEGTEALLAVFSCIDGLAWPGMQRELVYLRAVGKYRVGKLLEARRQLDELLKVVTGVAGHVDICVLGVQAAIAGGGWCL